MFVGLGFSAGMVLEVPASGLLDRFVEGGPVPFTTAADSGDPSLTESSLTWQIGMLALQTKDMSTVQLSPTKTQCLRFPFRSVS